ncbi:Choline transporter-like protein 1 [Araneus ventricosus]|uniref:Choline transporter-like protein n=1 Tax=Araneus ventricosus TaxID=182803 RepID=A0A4Y2PDK7_ARAVE|nr:Choline transporter-like protein 1 [Araneus ventricosus]
MYWRVFWVARREQNFNSAEPKVEISGFRVRLHRKSTLRRCLPAQVTKATSKIFQLAFFEEVGSDISLCWKEIILLFVISIGLSLLLLLLFRFCAAIIIWAVLLGVTAVSIGVTIYLWYKWNEKKQKVKGYEGPNKDLKERQVTYWLVAAIVSTIFTVIYLLVIVFMRNKIKLVAALFKEAGKSISAMPLILLQPIETFISIAVVCCFLLMGFLCLQTSGKPLVDSKGRVTFQIETFFQVMRWLLLFGFIWLTQFVMACQNFVVAGAVVNWFFTRDKHRLGSPISKSLCMLICYHLGSVAFGSLIIAIMKAIRALFRLIQKHMNNQNQRCDIFWKFFQCCLACFENYLKFLSKNAYIMIAIFGDSFCASARKSFGSLTANILKIAAVDCIGDFILFIGKMGVTISIALIALEILKNVDGLNYIWIPVAISCVFAFLCCHCFLSVYEMAIDTLMLCFCEDCQMNDGITRPYFMSKSLMTFVENSRRNARISPTPKGKELD